MVEKISKSKNTKQRGSRSGSLSKFDEKDSASKAPAASAAPRKVQNAKPGSMKSSTTSSSDVSM